MMIEGKGSRIFPITCCGCLNRMPGRDISNCRLAPRHLRFAYWSSTRMQPRFLVPVTMVGKAACFRMVAHNVPLRPFPPFDWLDLPGGSS